MEEGMPREAGAVTFKVPDLDAGVVFSAGHLGHALGWRNDEIGQAGLALPRADPFGNVLVLVDLAKGRCATDDAGHVTEVTAES